MRGGSLRTGEQKLPIVGAAPLCLQWSPCDDPGKPRFPMNRSGLLLHLLPYARSRLLTDVTRPLINYDLFVFHLGYSLLLYPWGLEQVEQRSNISGTRPDTRC